MNDWRLTNQENYLKGKVLLKKLYKDRKSKTTHDHCEFCMGKFSENPNDYTVGYCTEDYYHWICENCFEDFKELFKWKIKE